MSLRQMMSFFIPQGSGEKVCWMKNEKKNCVSVMAVVPGVVPMRRDVDASKVEVLATRAKASALSMALQAGRVQSSGVVMGGNGNGPITATGYAEVPWSPEVERRLESCGIHRVR